MIVRVVNDLVAHGRFGEKTLWAYLTDDLGWSRADYESTGATSWYDLKERCWALPVPDACVQNATWAPPHIGGPGRYVALLQDNLRRMYNDPVPQHPTLAGAAAIVCPGTQVAADYAEYEQHHRAPGAASPRIRVIPIGVDTEFWRGPETPADAIAVKVDRDIVDGDRKRAIFVGDAGEHKGYDAVLRLARVRRDLNWTIVCKTGAPGANEVADQVLIACSRDTMRLALRSADVFVLASPAETQCMAALEAMACGLPVVMPATGVFADWRPPSFFEAFPADPMLFSAALDRALASVGQVDPRADLLAAERFTVKAMLASWKRLVAELLDQ